MYTMGKCFWFAKISNTFGVCLVFLIFFWVNIRCWVQAYVARQIESTPKGTIVSIKISLNHCTADFYADDSTLHISDKNKTQIETKLQSDSDQVTNWSKNNKMPINYNKTTIMTLGSRHNICKSEKININIDNHQIDTVSSHKLLGVYIDETLSWNPHIDYLCSVITSRITLLKQLSFYVPENIQKLFLSELHIAVDRLWLQLMGININYKY